MLGEGRQFDEVNDGAPSGRAQSDGGSLNHSYSRGLLALLPKVLFSLSALVVSVTASLIAWEHLGPSDLAAAAASQTSQLAEPLPTNVSLRLANLESKNRALRAELDGLVGPGGVLPRIIERLQEEKRVEAIHQAAIDQLFQLMARKNVLSVGETQALGDENGAPVSVTHVGAAEMDRPVRVIVTPNTETPTPEVRSE